MYSHSFIHSLLGATADPDSELGLERTPKLLARKETIRPALELCYLRDRYNGSAIIIVPALFQYYFSKGPLYHSPWDQRAFRNNYNGLGNTMGKARNAVWHLFVFV